MSSFLEDLVLTGIRFKTGDESDILNILLLSIFINDCTTLRICINNTLTMFKFICLLLDISELLVLIKELYGHNLIVSWCFGYVYVTFKTFQVIIFN